MPAPAERPNRWRAVSILVALGLFTLLSLPFVEYLTDDTFIFLRYARHFAQGLGLAFNPGEPTYGFTSVLWVWLLAPAFKLGISPIGWAKALALGLALAAILGFGAWARRRLSPIVAAAAMVAFAANGWLVRWTAAAMETALVLALITWGLWRTAVEAEEPERRPLAALIFAVGVLARPEVALLLVLTLATDLVRGRLTRAVAGAVVAGIVIGPWLGYAHATFGHVLPDTAAAKGRLALSGLDLDPLLDIGKGLAATSVAELLWLLVGVGAGWRLLRASVPSPLEDPETRSTVLAHAVPLLWLLGLPLAYVLAGFDVLSRYVLLLTPVVVLYGFLTFDRLAGRSARGQRRALKLAGFVLAQNILLLARVVYPHTHAFSRGVEDCLGGLGRYCAEHTPPGSQVAIADIGAFGYYADRPVLDLAGLVSPAMIPIVNQHPIEDIARDLLYAEVARPDYLVDRAPEPERLAGGPGGVFEPLTSCRVEGLGVRAPAPIAYTLYRVHWDRWSGAAAAR